MLSALVGAAAAWPVLLLGIAMPKIAVFALGFVPAARLGAQMDRAMVWIGLAATIPLAVGLTMAMRRPHGRASVRVNPPAAQESAFKRLLRGLPTTVGIAAAFFVVFVTVPALRDRLPGATSGRRAGSAADRQGAATSRSRPRLPGF